MWKVKNRNGIEKKNSQSKSKQSAPSSEEAKSEVDEKFYERLGREFVKIPR